MTLVELDNVFQTFKPNKSVAWSYHTTEQIRQGTDQDFDNSESILYDLLLEGFLNRYGKN